MELLTIFHLLFLHGYYYNNMNISALYRDPAMGPSVMVQPPIPCRLIAFVPLLDKTLAVIVLKSGQVKSVPLNAITITAPTYLPTEENEKQ